MNDRKIILTLDYDQFNAMVSQQNLYNLRHEFKMREVALSPSLLVWKDESEPKWLLADFETKNSYDLERKTEAEKSPIVEVWEPSNQIEQLIDLKDPKVILSRLRQLTQKTNEGYVDF